MEYQLTIRITGIILLLIGILLVYIVARRKFNRRTVTGLEGFKSFERAWLTTFLEKFGSLIAKLLVLAGVALIILSFT